ncbi:hypothetical protein [Halobacillus litoralis]|uniref:Uncharacterized protein n=1 Tax=Halobacillus litoralis TaxID=45668 RepID=A0A410MA15_9BACI|nr:hypothetical protein [Halobacillus litoralis]QAS51582.1 hypothetical protein HLI_04745 [Halobacillus litoralis]
MDFISYTIQQLIHSQSNVLAAKLLVLCVCLFSAALSVDFMLSFIPIHRKLKEGLLTCSMIAGAYFWYEITFI